MCQEVKVVTLNSTAAHVSWKPPLEKDRNGVIRGYHIHVQEVREDVSFPQIGIVGKIEINNYSLN